MSQFADLLQSLGCTYEKSSTEGGLDIYKVVHNGRDFVALIFSDESGELTFVRLMFIVDRLHREKRERQYETLLELNRECWLGSFAVEVPTSSVLYVINFPLPQFDADALAIAEETFDLALQLYAAAFKE